MKSGKILRKLRANNIKTSILWLLLLLPIFFVSGCWNQIEVNDTAEAEGLVFDLEGGQPSFSVQLANPGGQDEPGESKACQAISITQTGRTFTEAARKTMLSLPRLPLWAHSGVVVIGRDLANTDLARVADFIARNRSVRKTALVFVSSGASGKELMEAQVPLESYSLAGLKKIMHIQEQQLGIYSSINLDKFLDELATPGIEPAVPEVSIEETEGEKILRITGTAVFKDHKRAGSLNEKESQGYRFLNSKMITGGLIIVQWPLEQNSSNDSNFISIELSRSKASIEPQIEANRIKKMNIQIDAEGNFYEQTFTGDVLTLKNIKVLEQLVDEKIKENIAASILKAQALDSDIFGWGQQIYRTNPDLWQQLEQDWPVIFPGIEVDITVDFSLRRAYLLDKSFTFK